MPEGLSLVMFRKDLQRFAGQKVQEACGVTKTMEPERLKGKKITAIQSHGKHLLISFGDVLALRVHFLMFGKYAFDQTRAAPLRLHLGFAKEEVNFYTCDLRLIEGNLNEVYDWRSDIMSDAWSDELALKKLKDGLPDRMICDALMDQDIFAGLGNIIKNEVLFRTKIQPESRVGAIPARRLKELIRDVVEYAQLFLPWREEGTLKKHWEAHTKKKCVVCGGKIEKIYAGKAVRRSFFCGVCQDLYV